MGRGLIRAALRMAGFAVFAVVVLVAAGLFAAHRYLTPELLRSVIVTQLSQTFRRPVSMRRVSFVLHQGVRVDGLEVREEGGGEFLSSEALLIKYNFAALLEKRLELGSIRLLSPRIRLVRRADGHWNFSDLLKAPAQPKGPFALPPLQSAERIIIEHGELRVSDAGGRWAHSVSDLRLSAQRPNLETPFPVEFSCRYRGEAEGKGLSADLEFDGVLSPSGLRPGEGILSARKFAAVLEGERVSLSGAVHGFPDLKAELKLSMPRLTSQNLSRYFRVPTGIDLAAREWAVRASSPKPEEGVPFLRRLFVLESAESEFAQGKVSMRGSLEGGRRAHLSVTLRDADLGRVARHFSPLTEKGLTGKLDGNIVFDGEFPKLAISSLSLLLRSFAANLPSGQGISGADLRVRAGARLRPFDLEIRKGSYIGAGHVLSDLSLDARLDKGALEVRAFEGTWNKSKVKLKGCVRDVASPKRVVVDGTVDSLRVDEFYAAIMALIERQRQMSGKPKEEKSWLHAFKYSIPKRFPDLRGKLRVLQASSPNFRTQNVELAFDLRGIARGLKDAEGSFRVGFGPGRVDDVPAVRSAHRVLNVLLLPYSFMHELNAKTVVSLATAEAKTLDFNRNYGDFSVSSGAVDMRFLHVDSPQLVGYSEGGVDFSRERIDARVLIRLTKHRSQLPERLVDTAGRPSVELLLKDDLNKPTAELTLRKIGYGDIEDALAGGLKKASSFDPLDGISGCTEAK